MVQAGDDAPDFELVAAVSERAVSKAELAGRKVVLIMHGPRTTDAPKEVGKAVRAAHESADEVFVANVVNLKSMAGLWKKVATAQIKQTYEKLASKLDAPEDYVAICPDWDNVVAPSFGVTDSNQTAAAVVIDAAGKVVGVVEGDDLGPQVVELLG